MRQAARRPPRRKQRGLYIGVDVGGTKVLAGVVTSSGAVAATAHRSTPGRAVAPTIVEDALVEAVLEVADGATIAAVGVAAAGFVDQAGERVMFAPHLPWRGEPVRAHLQQRWGSPVVLDNDANCAAVGEWTYGAARGTESALMITLGTGIGSAILLDGVVHRGRNGMAGEFGHMQMVPGGLECECGGSGCWEQYCSGKALLRFVRARLGSEPTSLEEACAGDPAALTGPMVTEAAMAGDAVAAAAYREIGTWLGVGIANLVAAFDPDCVVVGGGVSDAGDLLLGPAREALSESLVGAAYRVLPPVHRAELGPEAGLVGAAALARATLRPIRRAIFDGPLGGRSRFEG
jgi:glucokinase